MSSTGNWELPFLGSMALMLIGVGMTFFMHPERRLDPGAAAPSIGTKGTMDAQPLA